MNMILLEPDDFNGSECVSLTGRRFEHIRTILKPSVGDRLSVGLLNDKIGSASVSKLTEHSVDLKVDLTDAPPEPLKCQLILACPRPIVLKRLLAGITSLGIKDIYLIQTSRVEKSYWKSPVLKPKAIEEAMKLGLEQARDTVLPKVILKNSFKPFIEDEIPDIIKDTEALFAHPVEGTLASHMPGPVTLAVGPEGGFVDFEVDKLKEAGFKGVQLGERILRVETAVAALIGKICL